MICYFTYICINFSFIIYSYCICYYIFFVNFNAWAFALMSAYTFAGVFNYLYRMVAK